MDSAVRLYMPYIGLFPSYGTPDQVDEDDEFAYFLFRIPRHYIRGEIEAGVNWIGYEETEEEGEEDPSVVLGMRFLPVYVGVEEVAGMHDADFYYYRCRVPKAFLESPITLLQEYGIARDYWYVYDAVEVWEMEDPEGLEEDEEFNKAAVPKAGEGMPDRQDLNAVRKAKEDTYLYRVAFKCNECETQLEPVVSSDLFDAISERECDACGSGRLTLISSKAIKEDDNDGEGNE
jgi:hypothetical protein